MRVTVAFKAPRLGPRARLRRALLASAEDPKSGIFIPNAAASYSLLWYVITLSLARKSATFVHGAAFEQNGKAVLLAGSGGCGKTSTLLLALKQPNTRYLAEDFATLSTDGDVYYTPKTVTLYRSDVEASSLQNPGVNSSSFRRFAFLTRDKNPKLKVSPNALVGSSLGTRCPLGLACMLVRTDASNFSLNPISVDELSWRIAQASMRELKPLAEILQMLSANAPHDYGFPSATDLEKRMLDTYHAVFSKADARLLVIPHKQPPSELIKFLQAEKVLSA
jgi:hypothetical protein